MSSPPLQLSPYNISDCGPLKQTSIFSTTMEKQNVCGISNIHRKSSTVSLIRGIETLKQTIVLELAFENMLKYIVEIFRIL